jgi:hypothetical protein
LGEESFLAEDEHGNILQLFVAQNIFEDVSNLEYASPEPP